MRSFAHCVLAWLALAATALAEEPAAPESAMQADAQLADVDFIDRAHGWAVGDRGVIWHTADGGAHWNLESSGVDCRLSGVHFLSDKVGWAAGGYTQPYSGATVGVVLHTRDGGQTWRPLRTRVLPAIRRIGFFDLKQGWAIGQASAYFPTGVYTTDDGGQTWSAVSGAVDRAWRTGDFVDPNTGALAGGVGALAAIRRRGIEPLPSDFGLRTLARMKLAGPQNGWLVGDGGLVLKSADQGKSWQTPDGPLPPGAERHFDFEALAVVGQRCWVAGTPGTRVLHTADGGQTWQAFNTGQPLPIRSLAFVDDENGWAVGDLGIILSTSDGGRSWKRQRAGAARAAFAGFFGGPGEIPLELLARLAADDGYIGAMEILTRDASSSTSPLDPAAQTHEAAVAAGASLGSAAWRFPIRSAGLKLSAQRLAEDWNRANDGEALERIEAHVVGRIRMWRPNVVVAPAADTRDPLALAINQIVLRAVERAADPARHADQISQAGLEPWKVQKVYAAATGEGGTIAINTAQVTPRLGRSIGELVAPARGLVAREHATRPDNVSFRLLVDHVPQDVGKRDFFSGISLAPGSEARRAYVAAAHNNLEAARREAQRYRNLQAILAQADGDPRGGTFLANIADQTRDLEPSRAADVLFQLAARYARRGRWDLAAECQEVIVERYAAHPLAGAALVWLIQYHASGEVARHSAALGQVAAGQVLAAATPQHPTLGNAPAATPPTQQIGDGPRTGAAASAGEVVQTGHTLAGPSAATERAEKAVVGYAHQLEQVEPALAFEPRVRFPLAVAQRRQGLSGSAERFCQALVRTRPSDAWSAIARTELWLLNPQDRPPKPLLNCRRAEVKPRLDGRLEESIWRSASYVELRSPERDDDAWTTAAMLGYDDEFLYIGLSCSRAGGFRYDESRQPRPRDADLSNHDRVELFLDVDRDFATFYRLAIDHRGWPAESCWHDATWNPTWFIASSGDDETWTAEAAIPLAELADETPEQGKAWAIGIQRVVPGVGFQSWTTPAAPEVVPQGFGYLMFQ